MTAPRYLSCGCIRWNADITHYCWRHVQDRRRLRAAGIPVAADPYKPLPRLPKVKARSKWKAMAVRWWRRIRGQNEVEQIRKAGF